MNEHEKSPAQGGEMPPVERAAITGSGGIDTVRGATPAGNAAQERNTNAAALDRDIAQLIECCESGIARVPRETLVRLRTLLTSPRAAVPAPEGWKLVPIEPTEDMIVDGFESWPDQFFSKPEVWASFEKMSGCARAAHKAKLCYAAMLDAAPGAPVAAPAPDPLRRRVERLLVELHAEGRMSEGQCAKMLDISRVDWRELAEFLAPGAQAVAADGASAQHCNLGVGCDEAGVCYASAHGDASQCGRAAVSPATADRICTLIPLSELHPVTDEHPRVIVFTDGSDFNGAQFFDVSADTLNECFYESPDDQPEVCRHATHWMPRPSLRHAAPATADERAANPIKTTERDPSFIDNDLDFEPDAQHAVADMANIGYALMQTIERMAPGYCWNESPTEIVSDLINERDEARASQAAAPADAREPVGRFDKSLNQIRWRDGLVNADFADRQPFFTQPVGTTVDAGESFQSRVHPWLLECFGPTIATDTVERNHRFLEEALETVQSLGCTASEAHQLVDYTFGRPVGEPAQEVGGVMVTLAALCLANTLDMHAAGEAELARISEPAMVEKIRAKQAAKPKHSPLPQAVAARAPYEWRDTGPLETSEGGAA